MHVIDERKGQRDHSGPFSVKSEAVLRHIDIYLVDTPQAFTF